MWLAWLEGKQILSHWSKITASNKRLKGQEAKGTRTFSEKSYLSLLACTVAQMWFLLSVLATSLPNRPGSCSTAHPQCYPLYLVHLFESQE